MKWNLCLNNAFDSFLMTLIQNSDIKQLILLLVLERFTEHQNENISSMEHL